jgi:hypothetical protein
MTKQNVLVLEMFKANKEYENASKALKATKLAKLDSAIDKFLDYAIKNKMELGI